MSATPFKILLIEDNPGDARLVREMLTDTGGQGFAVECVSRLAEGLERLGQGDIDLVLLDLDLPDSRGLDTFISAYTQASHVPFVVLTGLADETMALAAVRHGAQDYLFKDETYPHLLLRAIRYATERKKAETALESERKKLFSLLNSLPAFVHLKGADHRIRFANRRFIEYFGDPGDKPCYEAVRGNREPCEDCRAMEVLKTKVPQKFEWTSPLNSRTYEIYNYPFCTDEGMLVLTLGIDITESTQAREAVKDREEQLTAIYENAPLIMMLMDGDRRVRKVNKLAEQFAGASEADLVDLRGGEALRCLHSLDDPEGCGAGPHCQDCAVRRTVLETFETGRSHHQIEACLPFALEGKPQDITFLLCTARLAVRGQPQVLVTIQDITKRKQAEENLRQSESRYRLLYNTMAQGVIYWDADGKIISMNRAAERILGKESAEVLGKALIPLEHPVVREDGSPFPASEHPAAVALRTGQEVHNVIMRIYNPREKGYRWINMNAVPLTSKRGNRRYQAYTVFEDITERKLADEKLRESEYNLRYLASQLITAQERERERISRELHDELGQSLLVLKLQANRIARKLGENQDTLKLDFQEIMRQMDRLVDEIRRLARDLSPTMVRDLGLSSALRRLIEDFSRSHDIQADFRQAEGLDDLFPREGQINIYRIFQESLTNIGKYAQASRLTIDILRDDSQVSFMVEDNGEGFNVVEVLGRDHSHRGLGLLAMDERVRMMGGSLEIKSEEGKGTRITFIIPVNAS